MEAVVGGVEPGEVARVWARLRPWFARAEMRVRSRRYLEGLLGNAPRKNGWQLAEAAGERTPDGMQDFLNRAVWDVDGVRDELRTYVVEHLADPAAVLVIDETGFLKKGTHSVGVRRQYSGTAGRIENCQIGVFLAYATVHGHAYLDRALYLPREWATDRARCQAAGVPDGIAFATKPDLAQGMVERALDAGVGAAWVTGDEVYGAAPTLREVLETRGQAYVLGVSIQARVVVGGTKQRADGVAAAVAAAAWQRRSAGGGAKGPRWYDWTWVRLDEPVAAGWGRWLLLRRSLGERPKLAYYRVFAPEGTPLAAAVQAAGTRWAIETGFEAAKQEVGLADYEVRQWTGWHRHITLALLAHAILAVTRASAQKGGGPTTR